MKKHTNNYSRFILFTFIGIGIIVISFQLVAQTDSQELTSGTTVTSTDTSTSTQNTPTTATSTASTESGATTTPSAATLGSEQTVSTAVSYSVPSEHGSSGIETIDVSVTIDADRIVTAVETDHSGGDHHSVRYQNAFDQGYESYVIGETLDSIELSRISGASLTTDAFNEAIEDILAEI